MTLAIARDKLAYVIDSAERLEAVSATLSDALDAGGGRGAALKMYFESPTRRSLLAFISALTPEERRELVALMWLGRGDRNESADDWPDLLREAGTTSPNGDVLGLVGRNLLSVYLRRGIEKLDAAGAAAT